MILFILLSLLASVTLFAAFIWFLAELLGSAVVALLIVGGVAAVGAIISYYVKVRPELRQFRHEISVIYEVTSLFHALYRWVTAFIK